MITIPWSALKQIAAIKGSLQHAEDSDNIYVFLVDGTFTLTCIINKNIDKESVVDFESNFKSVSNKTLNLQLPFASKCLADGKKLYRRVHGISAEVQNASDNIDFTIPYNVCKITGVQILNGKIGDKANFKILDSSTGTISGIPNYTLNQFGFNVNIVPDVANYPSKYDADLVSGLVLRIEYDAVDELLPRIVYINFDLHEVKP